MTTATIRYFDTHEFIKKYKELATKGDVRESELRLQKEIIGLRNQMIFWVAGLIIASGAVQHFFK
jgi:hypothetical protein